MDRYEVAVIIREPEHVDAMILGLVHQGYSVYYNREEARLCFTASDDVVTKLETDTCLPR